MKLQRRVAALRAFFLPAFFAAFLAFLAFFFAAIVVSLSGRVARGHFEGARIKQGQALTCFTLKIDTNACTIHRNLEIIQKLITLYDQAINLANSQILQSMRLRA